MDQIQANANVVGAKGTINLGGKVYLVDPIGDPVWGTFAKWARQQIKANPAKKPTPIQDMVTDPGWKELSPELQAIMAKEVAAALPAQSKPKAKSTQEQAQEQAQEYLSVLMTDAGVAFMLWLLVRGNHPEATLPELTKAVIEAGYEQVTVDLHEAGSFEAYQESKKKAENGKTP